MWFIWLDIIADDAQNVSREYHVTKVKAARIDPLARAVLPEDPRRKGEQGECRGVD